VDVCSTYKDAWDNKVTPLTGAKMQNNYNLQNKINKIHNNK
jgi:hypothetical protein